MKLLADPETIGLNNEVQELVIDLGRKLTADVHDNEILGGIYQRRQACEDVKTLASSNPKAAALLVPPLVRMLRKEQGRASDTTVDKISVDHIGLE
jgi:hypothetical protein